MQWYAGTSGYSYKEWKGVFYPEDLPADRMLEHYAGRLPAVEINNTFYRMPRAAVLEAWAAAVPEHFRFVIKASRRITHHHRLKDAAEPTGYFISKLDALDGKLGAVLFQLPPNLKAERERLERFLDLLGPDLPAAFEFRHPSWHEPEMLDLLAERGAALCVSDDTGAELPDRLHTASWLYLRLRRPEYTDQALRDWVRRGRTTGAESAYVFFKHEDAGAGPAMAARFLGLCEPRERRAPRAVRHRPPAADEAAGA